ncbi:MAG: hypothetical protein WDZ54_02435 [Sneathiella sp.]
MDIRELTFRGEDKAALYACGKCGQCFSPKIYAATDERSHEAARAAAEKCCVAPTCSVCGVEVGSPWTMCAKHREQAALRRAAVMPAAEWADPVFSDEVSGDWGEGYSSDVAAMLEHFEDEMACVDDRDDTYAPDPPPAYCWPCKPDALRLDPESLLEQAADGHHEDAFDQIEAGDELVAFINAWNAKQTCVSWYPDYKRVVVLDEARFRQLLEDGMRVPREGKVSRIV